MFIYSQAYIIFEFSTIQVHGAQTKTNAVHKEKNQEKNQESAQKCSSYLDDYKCLQLPVKEKEQKRQTKKGKEAKKTCRFLF